MKDLIDIPVIYDAEVIMKRGRVQRMVKLFDIIPFEVSVSSAEERPEIASLDSHNYYNINLRKNDDGVIQSFGRKQQILNLGNLLKVPEVNMPRWCDFSKNIDVFSVPQMNYLINGNFSSISAIPCDFEFKRIISDNREKSICDMKQFMDDMVLIDNVFFRPLIGTPCFQIWNSYIATNMDIQNYTERNKKGFQRVSISHGIPFPLYMAEKIKKTFSFCKNISCVLSKPDFFKNFDVNLTYEKIIELVSPHFIHYLAKVPGTIPCRNITIVQKAKMRETLCKSLNSENISLKDIDDLYKIVCTIRDVEGDNITNRIFMASDWLMNSDTLDLLHDMQTIYDTYNQKNKCVDIKYC